MALAPFDRRFVTLETEGAPDRLEELDVALRPHAADPSALALDVLSALLLSLETAARATFDADDRRGCGGERDREPVSPRIIRMMDDIFYDRKTERKPAREVTSYTSTAPRSGSDI